MKSLALVLPFVASCMLDYAPDVGPLHAVPLDEQGQDGGVHGCSNQDSNEAVAVSFSAHVRPLMTRSPGGCASCHLGRVTSGLDLSSYEAMRRGGLYSGARLIVDGNPCDSILVHKIGRTPPFGSRMPFNGPPYYSADEIQIVSDWIAEGAANN